MCRMIGIIREGSGVFEILKEFRGLAAGGKVLPGAPAGHKDGWGLAAGQEGAMSLGDKNCASAADRSEQERFDAAARKIDVNRAPVIVGHLRKALPPTSRTLENTHPFQAGPWVFCHNGTLFEAEEQLPLAHYTMEGVTDSERLFKYILEQSEGMDFSPVLRAISKTVQQIRAYRRYTAMNFIMTNGTHMIVYRDFNEHYSGGDATAEELHDYYTLFCAKDKDVSLVCSEPIGGGRFDWQPLANQELLMFSRE
jgi:predicted glutamine amidotransferase